jgi:two-component system sensor histidine kinase KdpD
VAVLVGALRALHVAAAGVAAPLLLLEVVIIARLWEVGPALAAAGAGAAAYSYYFLPPAGFGIDDPDDWIAFVVFIVTAVIAGELASRAERRAIEAQEGRREIERLYQELQAAFDRASEAEAARRNEELKSALLDALTHNLRTPLTAIKAAVTALIGGAAWRESPLSREGQAELLQVIDEESDRLNRFIEGLSKAGSPDHGQPLSLRAVPLDAIVKAGLGRAETLLRDHRIEVSLENDLPMVSVDAASAAEVLYILLDNASKYSPAGTRVRVMAQLADARYVKLTVSDEGPGIPPELREKVFEKFFRIASRPVTDPRRKGIGLGLPIARRLVETQGGRIWIETPEWARGTTFALTLPISAEAPPTQSAEGPPQVVAAVE